MLNLFGDEQYRDQCFVTVLLLYSYDHIHLSILSRWCTLEIDESDLRVE